MRNWAWAILICVLLFLCALVQAQTPTPTPPIQPVVNGKVFGDLDMSNFRLLNWDHSNWDSEIGGGGGGGTGLPSGAGHAGQFLQTDGTNPLWAQVGFASISGKPTALASWGITLPLPITDLPTGTTSTTVALGNDGRFPATVNGLRKGRGAGSLDIPAIANSDYVTPDSAGRAAMGLVIGTNVQAYDDDLQAVAALSTQSFGRGLLALLDGPSVLSYIGGQPADADLTSLAAATGSNTIYYRSALNTWSPVTIGAGLSFSGGTLIGSAGAGGEITSPAGTYIDNELAVFSGTSGDVIKAGNFTGLITLNNGVVSTADRIAVTQGGTGLTSISLGAILYASGTNTIAALPANSTANNKYLRSFNLGVPSWQQIPFSDLVSTPTTAGGYGITDVPIKTNNLSDLSNIATARSNLGLAIGTHVQAFDADLTALAAINVTASGSQTAIPYRSGSNTWGTVTVGSGLTFSAGTLAATTTGGDTISDITSSVDGQLPVFAGTSGKHIKASSVTNSVIKLNGLGAVEAALPNFDFQFSSTGVFATPGTAGSPLAWGSGQPYPTVVSEGSPLTVDGYTILPLAANFTAGTVITYIDNVTVLNFGRNFRPANFVFEKLDNLTYGNYATAGTWVKPFIAGGLHPGQGIYQFMTDGSSDWRSVYANGRATGIQDANDASKQAVFDASAIATPTPATTPIPRVIKIPDLPSSMAVNQVGTGDQWLQSYTDGYFTLARPLELNIGHTGEDIVSSTTPYTVTNNGLVDTVNVAATLTGAIVVHWPAANLYDKNQPTHFRDKVGSLSKTTAVTIDSTNGDKFNGSGSIAINEAFADRDLVSDGLGNWSVSPFSGANNGVTIGWAGTLTEDTSAHTVTWNCLPGVGNQSAVATLTGNDTLVLNNPEPGMTFDLTVVQDGTGGHALTLPFGAGTPNAKAGVLYLNTAADAVTDVQGTYFGTAVGTTGATSKWKSPAMLITAATPTPTPSCNTLAQTVGGFTGTNAWFFGDASNGSHKYIAAKLTVTSTNNVICGFDAPLWVSGAYTSTITGAIYADDGTGTKPSGTPLIASNPVAGPTVAGAAGALSSPTKFTFTAPYTATVGTVYWVVISTTTNGTSSNRYNWLYTTSSARISYSAGGVTWTDSGAGQPNFHTFK